MRQACRARDELMPASKPWCLAGGVFPGKGVMNMRQLEFSEIEDHRTQTTLLLWGWYMATVYNATWNDNHKAEWTNLLIIIAESTLASQRGHCGDCWCFPAVDLQRNMKSKPNSLQVFTSPPYRQGRVIQMITAYNPLLSEDTRGRWNCLIRPRIPDEKRIDGIHVMFSQRN